ncbi:MAG: LysR family transcriptional regulator [Paracoccaceae bacterium]
MGRIELYRIFCRVVESGGFTRAAVAMNLPRSTVSTAVATLEVHLGTRLLHRTTRIVSVTRNGEEFYARCLALLATQEDMDTMFRPAEGRVEGRIHVNVPSRIGRLILVPALPGFLRDWPGIRVEIGMTDRLVDLQGEHVDCALRVGPVAASTGALRRIGLIEQINVASPAYLESFGTPRSPDDLDGHEQVGYAAPTTGRVMNWEWFAGDRTLARPVPWKVSANSAEGYIAGALAGLGMIQIPAFDVADHIAAGALVEIMPGFRPEPMVASLVFRHRQTVPRYVQIFADWLEALVNETVA